MYLIKNYIHIHKVFNTSIDSLIIIAENITMKEQWTIYKISEKFFLPQNSTYFVNLFLIIIHTCE